jgi:hypothetical protein
MLTSLLENEMANTTSTVAESVNSAVSVPAIETIGGRPVADVAETLVQLGFDMGKAHGVIDAGKRSLAQCDKALFDWVKSANYDEFQLIRREVILGLVDSGCSGSTNGAEQMWDKAVNRICREFTVAVVNDKGVTEMVAYARPKSQSKDAVRKSEAKAKLQAEFASKSDADLEQEKTDLLSKGDTKSLNRVKQVNAEMDNRAKPEIDKRRAELDLLVKVINEKVKALAKVGDSNAMDKLTMALGCLV